MTTGETQGGIELRWRGGGRSDFLWTVSYVHAHVLALLHTACVPEYMRACVIQCQLPLSHTQPQATVRLRVSGITLSVDVNVYLISFNDEGLDSGLIDSSP